MGHSGDLARMGFVALADGCRRHTRQEHQERVRAGMLRVEQFIGAKWGSEARIVLLCALGLAIRGFEMVMSCGVWRCLRR